MSEKDYYTTLHRSMFARINEVGAKPFLLFQYYLTYQTASDGIRPSLKRIALDMGIVDKKGNPQISAVSHLKKTLIEKGWIEEKDGEILITLVEKISTKLEKISTDELRKSQQNLRKSQLPIYRTEKEEIKDIEIIEKENLSLREPQKTKLKNFRYGIAVSEFDEGKQEFTDEIFDGLKSRLGTPAILPKEFEWLEAVNFAWSNKFPSTEFLKTYDLLEKIRKLRRKEWRITAGMIESNIANTAKLELEINNLEKSNGVNNGSTKTNQNGQTQERLNAIIADSTRFKAPVLN